MQSVDQKETLTGWRRTWHEIIFEADTFWGKAFDVLLIILILTSVSLVMADSVSAIHEQWGGKLRAIEWSITLLFTVEYFMRLMCVARPLSYALSFFGIVDLISILPSYVGLLLSGPHFLVSIRILRVLRVFRVFKLSQYIAEAKLLMRALKASSAKITVFMLTVMTLVIIIGSIMYIIEGPENGFTSIPIGIYWAIVTLTTVGFGDITPKTIFGQMFASLVMILGYGIIAVPTGIVTAELTKEANQALDKISTQSCMNCSKEGHDTDAVFCKSCGLKL